MWLRVVAAPGRMPLRLAGAAQALETLFTVGVWAALAWIAQGALADRAHPTPVQLALLLATGLLTGAAVWCAAHFQSAGRRRIGSSIRQQLVGALLPSRLRRAEPDAATAATAAVELADDVADYHVQVLPQRLSAPVSMATVFVVTMVVQWPAAVILLAATLLIPLNMRLAGLFAQEGADERLAASTRLGATVLDSFRGLRTLQSIGALERRRNELADAAEQLNAATMAIVRRAFLSGAVMDVVITFSIAANATYIGLGLLGYVHVGVAPPLTLNRGLLALLLCPMYFQPLRAHAAGYHARERALAAAATITALLDDTATEPTVDDRPTQPIRGPLTVVAKEVSFHHRDATGPILDAVDLVAEAGCWTAVIGRSGVGKTTLLSLVGGMRRPTTGSVRWVGPGGSTLPHLGGCAWIGQRTVILPGSIADNIRLGRPDASRVELRRAAAAAGLADVISLDTRLGEYGNGLSTGEARRVAIARAFLRDAPLWVLDEPTAHLDADAEEQVIAAMHEATRGRTVIVATHSAALMRAADAALTLADGNLRLSRAAIAA
jgi:ATP-binding cassette subfamily C protein CydD